MIKECIIHLEGVDKTGKDTIRSNIVKNSKGKYLIIVRSFISQIVYSRIYNRNINEVFFFKNAKNSFDRKEFFIYLYAEENVIKERFIKHNEKDLDINDIFKHINVFNDVIKNFEQNGVYILKVDTSNNSIEQCCNIILKYIDENNK